MLLDKRFMIMDRGGQVTHLAICAKHYVSKGASVDVMLNLPTSKLSRVQVNARVLHWFAHGF